MELSDIAFGLLCSGFIIWVTILLLGVSILDYLHGIDWELAQARKDRKKKGKK